MIEKYTMRSAFKRWLVLHNEEYRIRCRIRIPGWFHYYILKNTNWSYTIIDKESQYYANLHALDDNAKRRYKGYYSFFISDEELLNLQRTENYRN